MQSVIKGKNLISKPVSPIRKFQFLHQSKTKFNGFKIETGNITSTIRVGGGGDRRAIKYFYQKSRNIIEKCKLILF